MAAEDAAAGMAEEAFADAGMGDEASGEGTSFESVFESVKTSLPGLGKGNNNNSDSCSSV